MKTLLTLILSLGFAASLHAETPQEGAKAIRALIEAKKYEELFKTRYSEWHKVAKAGVSEEEAIVKMSKRFDLQHKVMMDLYGVLSTAKFEMGKAEIVQESETGKTATAKVKIGDKEIPFTLYEMKNGKWGFHM